MSKRRHLFWNWNMYAVIKCGMIWAKELAIVVKMRGYWFQDNKYYSQQYNYREMENGIPFYRSPEFQKPTSMIRKLLTNYFIMHNLSLVNPVNYIANTKELEGHSCSLCFTFKLELRKCSGPCQKNMCVVCIKKLGNNICPFCHEKLKLQNASFPNITYRCPSDSKQCKTELRTAKQFLDHCSQCTLINQELRLQFKYKIEYKCKCGLSLKFIGRSDCHECDLSQGARSKCQNCWLHFCTMCRFPPCTQQQCMNGHQIYMRHSSYAICDLCRLSISSLILSKTYTDRLCDFDVCAFCYKKVGQYQNSIYHVEYLKELRQQQQSNEGSEGQGPFDEQFY